jgi:hypothetical protein
MLSLEQEHYGLRFTDFITGFYPDEHPTMPGMAYLELKGSLITKGNKIKGSAPTLFDKRNSRRLVHNPNDLLSPHRLYELLRGFAHPDQEFIYCYKANRVLLDHYSNLPDCRGFQTNPVRRIRKNSIGKVRAKLNLRFHVYSVLLTYSILFCPVLRETQCKSADQEWASLQKPLLARVGFGNNCQQSQCKHGRADGFLSAQ